ncbi:MAG: autotransporter outer membrane beta-barrel domain-containing protein [Sphingomonadales bacterium]|nr:autotransporter outer membrane beta-barrel domain-containing protein [Sphingomonadaceae bacterium]MBS3929879.1 autotransporter outer membrane beta-barrel domain-containing protein [Sphingomonadales bacterium]
MRKLLFAAFVLGATPAFADAGEEPKVGGMRIEVHAGIERPNLSDTQGGTTYVASLGSGFVYGAEIGYDVKVSETVTVGPYLSFDAGGANKCENYTDPGVNGQVCFKSKSDLSVGLRGAARLGSKTELYLGLGYDVFDTDFTIVERNSVTNAVVFNYAATENRKGIGVSFGGNYDLSRNMYIGLGMRVSELGDFEGSGFKLQRFQGHATLGFRF